MQETKGLKQKKSYKKEYQKVRIGFMRLGTSLHRFCEANGINKGNVVSAFNGKWDGEKANELRQRLMKASMGK